ncbi:MAG: hypothetical protein HY006_03105 [Candidatus Sungbacteria bacterium]|nr:hypothetical protein [Candidatus Sungbacteria bacterium]
MKVLVGQMEYEVVRDVYPDGRPRLLLQSSGQADPIIVTIQFRFHGPQRVVVQRNDDALIPDNDIRSALIAAGAVVDTGQVYNDTIFSLPIVRVLIASAAFDTAFKQ